MCTHHMLCVQALADVASRWMISFSGCSVATNDAAYSWAKPMSLTICTRATSLSQFPHAVSDVWPVGDLDSLMWNVT